MISYYIYVSQTKIEMLFPQVPQKFIDRVSIKLKVGPMEGGIKEDSTRDPESLFYKTRIVDKYIKTEHDIGNAEEPKPFIYENMAMRWGALSEYASGIAFFGGKKENTYVALVSSTGSLVGNKKAKKTNHMYDYYLFKFFDERFDEPNLILPSKEVLLQDIDEKPIKLFLESYHRYIDRVKNQETQVEFLARTIYLKEQENVKYIVATPLYVALTESNSKRKKRWWKFGR